ncbi:class I SAM-dependent methyltransferase [Nocardia yamanashiensis]|uniref:class I SAM-dependent methyltransferase n=1 Tax=Nocardia yamanashiensis TaxID=209247 RepID=UPI000831530F|nr:class I SAM-dependent methyltransferase [Nocardia yamanashiensis]
MGRNSEWEIADRAIVERRANSFGAQAAVYDEHRPDYPIAAVRWALEPVAERGGVSVLDIGAGTGKLTGVLLAAGAGVTAVEPDVEMRGALEQRYPGVPTLAGTAESIPLPDDSVDAVLAGQAFHWFDLGRAIPEMVRVLRPGGVVAALWNGHDDSVEWVAELDRLSRSSVSTQRWNSDGLPEHPLLFPFERKEFPHSQVRTAESLTATIGTHSHTVVIPEKERADLLDRILDFLKSRPETGGGEFELPMRTRVIRAVVR